MAFGQVQQAALEIADQGLAMADLAAQVEADVGGDLVVARAPGVQFLAGIADQLGQARLDVHMHVFQLHRPGEVAAGDLAADLGQPPFDGQPLVLVEHADALQHSRMGQGAFDIDIGQAPVEVHGGGEGLHEGIGGFLESTAPHAVVAVFRFLAHGRCFRVAGCGLPLVADSAAFIRHWARPVGWIVYACIDRAVTQEIR